MDDEHFTIRRQSRFDWRAHSRKVAIVAAGGVCALVAVALLPHEVTWSDAVATPVSAPVPVVTVSPIAAPTVAAPVASYTAHGIVKSGQEAVIASRMTALITALPLEAGQKFGRGQLLASFDCSQMRAQLNAANAAAAAYGKTYSTNVELDQYKAIGTNEVAVSKANLGKAQAEAQAIRAGIGQCAIHAPFSGTVVERIAHPHDVAAAGQPLMKIQGAGDLEVELIVPSKWLTWLKPGSPFTFALDETGASVQGRIVRLGAAVDPVSKTMRVAGAISVVGTVVPGMSGAAKFDPPKDGPDGGTV
ncbi:MAG: efflux RND transporter periplasmic adaptor subunit [Pseudomonadota bacterium]